MHFRFPLAAALLCLSTAHAQAHDFTLGAIRIGHPYARATVAGQSNGGAFLSLANQGPDDRLIAASAAVAASVELHSMRMEGDVMRMRPVEAVALPAGQTVELKPGGLHVMFVGLKAPLAAGATFPLTLRFEKAGEVTVTVDVEPADANHMVKHH